MINVRYRGKWTFFPNVDHSIKPVAFCWIMDMMAAANFFSRTRITGAIVFHVFNVWQRVLLRFYRS